MTTSKPERALIYTILILALLVSYVQVYKAGQRHGKTGCKAKLEAISELYSMGGNCHG